MIKDYKCSKCGAGLEDWLDIDSFVGEWSEDRFRCNGHLISPVPFPQASEQNASNRTKSCGYFGLEELGEVYSDDNAWVTFPAIGKHVLASRGGKDANQ